MRLPPNDLGGLKIPFDETPSEPKKFPGICLRQLTRKFSALILPDPLKILRTIDALFRHCRRS